MLHTAESKVRKARATLVMSQPFFGALALRLKVEESNKIKTVDCDGATLSYNPEFINSLTVEQVKGVIAHTVMHPAMLHHTRRGNRDVKKWNKAADYAINGLVTRAGFALPPGYLIDAKYDGHPAEHIYTMLPDEDGDDECDGNDPGGCGGVSDPKGEGKDGDKEGKGGMSQSEMKNEELQWKIAVAQAAFVAKQQGRLPADMERFLDELMAPVIPWKEILRRFLTEKANDDFSWKKGNRRFISQGLYLPSRESESTGDIVVAIDTSGSIGQKELTEFGSEIQGIIDEVRPRKTIVIYCDAAVNKVVEFTPTDPVILEAVGGGGTDFRPPFHWLEEHGIEPKCLVYLTDGYGSFPEEHTVFFPVMWCINNMDVTPPFGEHLYLQTS